MQQHDAGPGAKGLGPAWAGELTEAAIRGEATPRSFERGEQYYHEGSVRALARRGDALFAEVWGSAAEPYTVTASVRPAGGIAADCTCPYDFEGWCKHIVAALLTGLRDPERIEERPTLASLLAPLDREALQSLLLGLAEENPDLIEEVETAVGRLATEPEAPPATAPAAPGTGSPDPAAIRKQVRSVLRSVSSYAIEDWGEEDGSEELEEGIRPVLESAQALVDAGDGRGALPLLQALTEELVDGWARIEDAIPDAFGVFDSIGILWAEALLSGDLTAEERQPWAIALRRWQDESEEFAAGDGLAAAAEAAKQGWDYPPLVRVLQGEITDKGAWEGEAPDGADELAVARLNVLERQGRLQEAAYLAEAESQDERLMDLLVRLGRPAEAVDLATKTLTLPEQFIPLARMLSDRGETALALRLAENGLRREGPAYTLATWLRDTALAAGDTERAVDAALAAIRDRPNLEDYQRLREIAGERWEQLREGILAYLRSSPRYLVQGRVEILLHEGMIDEALDVVRVSTDYDLMGRVVEMATPTRPLKVVPICRAQADEIMDAGKADRYEHAIRWLERAREAYRVAGQDAEWQAYRSQLLSRHARKYKLVPMLRRI